MARELAAHPRVQRLARRLWVEIYAAAGLVVLLWEWTARHAPAGDVGRHEDLDLADAVGWHGDPAPLVEALLDARWLARDLVYRLIVADWSAEAPDAVHRSLARAGRTFADGAAPKTTRLCRAERERLGKVDASCAAPATRRRVRAASGASGEPQPAPPRAARTRRRMPGVPAPDALTADEQAQLDRWCRSAHPEMLGELPRIAEKVLDWGRGKGEVRPGWLATIRNAVRNEADRRRERAGSGSTRGLSERPVERAARGRQASLFGDVE